MSRTKNTVPTELFVDAFIEKNNYPPTYSQVADFFKLSTSQAFARCRPFRHKMNRYTAKDDLDKMEKAKRLIMSCSNKIPNKIALTNIIHNSAAALTGKDIP